MRTFAYIYRFESGPGSDIVNPYGHTTGGRA